MPKSLFLIAMLVQSAAADEPQDSIQRGEQLLKEGLLWRARWAFENARTIAPRDARVHRLLGIVNSEIGNLHQAVEELQLARDLAPNDPRAAELDAAIREYKLQLERAAYRNSVGLLAGGLAVLAAGGAMIGGAIAVQRSSCSSCGTDAFGWVVMFVIGGAAEAGGLVLSIMGGVGLHRHPVLVAPSVSSRGGGVQLSLGF
jgi:hypothetical protein